MSESEKQALARWVDEKERHFNAHRKQFNLTAIILSVIDIALSIWTAYTVISVITSTVIAIVYGGRFWQLIKVEKLVKAVASGYFTYIKHKKEKSQNMKRILTNLKNNPLTIVLAIILSAIVGLAGYSIARTGYGASFGEVFDKDAGAVIVAEVEDEVEPEIEVEVEDESPEEFFESVNEYVDEEIEGMPTWYDEDATEHTDGEEIETEEIPAEDIESAQIATYALTEPALIGAACFVAVFILICWLGWDGLKAALARKIAKKKGITVDELEKLSTEADADIAAIEAEEAKEIEEDVKHAEYEALVEWLRTHPTKK